MMKKRKAKVKAKAKARKAQMVKAEQLLVLPVELLLLEVVQRPPKELVKLLSAISSLKEHVVMATNAK